jgi:DNA-binding NarL/FixJ family response regulator
MGEPTSAVDTTAGDATKIRVFLLDDHEVVRRGVQELLESESDIEVVGEASTAAEALARVPALRPDVAILDVRLGDGDGVSVYNAIMAGAQGYVLKQIRGSDLIGAVRAVAAGGSLLDPRATASVLARLRDQSTPKDPLEGLTEREREILELIGEGLSNREIGARLFLAEKTVKNYVTNLLAKLGMQRRTQVAIYAADVRHDREH